MIVRSWSGEYVPSLSPVQISSNVIRSSGRNAQQLFINVYLRESYNSVANTRSSHAGWTMCWAMKTSACSYAHDGFNSIESWVRCLAVRIHFPEKDTIAPYYSEFASVSKIENHLTVTRRGIFSVANSFRCLFSNEPRAFPHQSYHPLDRHFFFRHFLVIITLKEFP